MVRSPVTNDRDIYRGGKLLITGMARMSGIGLPIGWVSRTSS